MYLSKDREQAPKTNKMIIAAAAGLAVVGVATASYMSQEDSMDFTNLSEMGPDKLGHLFFTKLLNHAINGTKMHPSLSLVDKMLSSHKPNSCMNIKCS